VAETVLMTPAKYSSRFIEISDCLLEHRLLWSCKPFEAIPPIWAKSFPELSHWLTTLDNQQFGHYATDVDDLTNAVSSFIPSIKNLQDISKLNSLKTTVDNRQFAYINKGVAGRKWQQICDFSSILNQTTNPIKAPIVEWCAGKSHLGRLLSLTTKQAVTALELDPIICRSGQQLAKRDKALINHINCDVIEHGENYLKKQHTVVALHACGDLHTHLLSIAGNIRPDRLAIAPCCYQLTKCEQKIWLSDIGQQSKLQLTREDLKIALMDTVIATKRNIEIRNKFNQWRLGFDELQRECLASNSYLPVPPLPEKLLKGSFREFCQHVAEIKKIDIKGSINFQQFEQLGVERYKKTQRYALVRYIFRRPLEVLLNLDYCLFLQQHNYSVQLGEFSDYQTTPRNIMLIATQLKE
jgi:hypothetical protein